jgi:hypothetical protein
MRRTKHHNALPTGTPVPIASIHYVPMLLQIHPAVKMLLAMPMTSGFSRPWSQSVSISSAGARIIAIMPKVRCSYESPFAVAG